MIGHKKKEQKLFYNISLTQLVPEDNIYRRLSGALDLGFLYKRCKGYYGTTGNPSIDPEVFLKMCIYGYFEGIMKDRELIRKIEDSLSARLFIGYDIDEEIPWHSTVSRTRRILPKELFEELFEMVLGMCVRSGLVGGVKQAVDSTLVKANASLDSIELKKPEMTAVEYVEKTLRENATELDEDSSADGNKLEKIAQVSNKKTKSNNDYYSPTDPDSRIAKKPGKPTDLYYTNQLSVDTQKGIITSVTAIHSDKNDNTVLLEVVDKSQANLNKFGLQVSEIMTDGNYFSAENLKQLSERGIKGYIPPQKVINNKGVLTRDDFEYNEQTDIYTCKAGEKLTYSYYDKEDNMKVYKARSESCDNCKIRTLCCAGKSARSVRHSIHKKYVDELLLLEQTAAYKIAMKVRQATIERVFAEAKDNHGLRRLNTRGIDKAQKVFTMIAIVQNLKKLIKYGGKKTIGELKSKKAKINPQQITEKLLYTIFVLFYSPNYYKLKMP